MAAAAMVLSPEPANVFSVYEPESGQFFDEMFEAPGQPRPNCAAVVETLGELGAEALVRRQLAAEEALLKAGITFTLHGGGGVNERIMPFDIIPRIIDGAEWRRIEAGLVQRIRALNMFLTDVYGAQRIVKDGVVPESLIRTSPEFREPLRGFVPPRGIWIHITGTDLVRDASGRVHVLEDNARCPSGVSYVVENRSLLKRTFPRLFEQMSIRSVSDYGRRLHETLRFLAADGVTNPCVVVLTPGRFNAAYFEHAFLAEQMGVELVEAQDLVVKGSTVYMRTTRGLLRVDVIYRRIGDDFLDPEVFRPDSMLGVPGLMRAYLEGNVALANAPGTGVADDKAVYAYVERIIKYYLGEEAIIPNVPTYLCDEAEDRAYVLSHLEELVVKETDGAGGYGMLIGPHSTAAERAEFARRITANPRGYIAQPTLSLSRVPTLVDGQIAPRHVDLRPFALYGEKIYVQPGGLTRVALRKGSLVVNSSQGGGSKDTWVLA